MTTNSNSNFQRMQKQNHNPNTSTTINTKHARLLYSQPHKHTCNHQQQCSTHLFCSNCLTYNLCQHCLDNHREHNVLTFYTFQEAKEGTRELLLIEFEGTLNRLKGRENQMKNQVEEVALIKDKLKQLSQETIETLRIQLQELERKVAQKLQSEFDRYQKELDTFYREYNDVNDYLRDNLLKVIDGQIDPFSFGKHNVCRDIDPRVMPNFGKIKQAMEMCKKYLKNVRTSVGELQNSIRFFSAEEVKNRGKFQKYDRFLKERTYQESEYNSPLLRTLNILEASQGDMNLIRAKLRN